MATLLKDSGRLGEDEIRRLVDPDRGIVSGRVFTDPDVYQLELERIFLKSWCFLGHESQIRNPGDFFASAIGEDRVIVVRGENNEIHVLLNSCRHRGLAVCGTDRGNTSMFICPYHGWGYARDGSLLAVPLLREAYHGNLDKSAMGLVRVPKVASYKGLIFANWDEDAMPLEQYLTPEQMWYLDLPLVGALGGLEVIGPVMKYRISTNWKLASENFAGDDYHVLTTHGSAFKIGFLPPYDMVADYIAYFDNGHGMGDIPKPGRALQNDLHMAQMFGSEGVEYVQAYNQRLREHLSERQAEIHGIGEGNIFPNMSWIKFGCFHVLGLYSWHPKGPNELEVWQICLFDSAAPPAIREFARTQMSQENAAGGIFGPDDGENFERISEALRGKVTGGSNLHYAMGVGHDGQLEVEGLPGKLGPHFSEQNHRNFYRHWLKLMTAA